MFNKTDCNAEDIGNLTRRLPEPEDYYLGLPATSTGLPEYVLLFRRESSIRSGSPSSHHRFVFICSLEESGTVIVDNCAHRLTPGRALLVLPHQFHEYANFSSPSVLWLFVTFEMPLFASLKLMRLKNTVFMLSEFDLSCLQRIIEEYLSRNSRAVTLLLATVLESLRGGVGDEIPGGELPESHNFIQQVADFVYRNINEPIHIADVADFVHLSPSHVRGRFRKVMGMGLGVYIRRTRIHRARVLLKGSDATISQIADQCGFSSLYAFSRTFRAESGVSPSGYRRRSEIS